MNNRVFKITTAIFMALSFFLMVRLFGIGKQLTEAVGIADALNDSIHYYQNKSIGDSFMLSGDVDQAEMYYHLADSISGKALLAGNLDKRKIAQKAEDSLFRLKIGYDNLVALLETENYSNRMDVQHKDSAIAEYNAKITSYNQQIEELRTKLAEASQPKAPAAVAGKLEFEISTGTKVYYAGDVLQGKAEGYGYGLFGTGGVYEGDWRANKRHGKGKYTWKDGNIYSGEFKEDKRHGYGTYYFIKTGDKYEGEWRDNKRNGKGMLYSKDGKEILNGIWENDEFKN
jgi:hypothetical protein